MLVITKKKIIISILFLLSLLINQYYGNKGVFPVDSFSHFDTGFRILLGEYPFKDYWIVSGPFVDYLQSIFFYFFGINWQIYILHASIINAVLAIATFIVLINFKLNINYSFFYALFFSILAYPSSGTPFVDHHSAFFSLLGIYSLILGIQKEEKKYWISLPIFFIFAFLSKQVPASYIILSTIFILLFYTIIQKKYIWIKYSFSSFVVTTMILLFFLKIQSISINSFLEQYIYYPQTIAAVRFDIFNLTFNGLVGQFKFIYIAIAPLFFINLKKIIYEKNYLKSKNFINFFILFLLTFSLIFHQLLTRNQIFIFFLIPILFAFSDIASSTLKNNKKKLISLALISVCLFATAKYHIRFNENRKFHELNYVNFDQSLPAKEIDKKFLGLKWITPEYKNESKKEIIFINEIKSQLSKDDRTKMLWTNYSFFSVVLNEKLFSPTRWHIFDGTDYPQKNSEHFNSYKNLLIKLIKNNNISVIYTIHPIKSSLIYTYLDKDCFTEIKISKMLSSHELKDCYK